MKKRIISGIVVFVIGVLTPHIGEAQGTTYISDIGQPSVGDLAVGSDSWLAALVITGNNPGGYTLDSVQLGMTGATGNPSGFNVMFYSSVDEAGPIPGANLGTLSGTLDPVTAGNYTYTAPANLTLSPDTEYFIVLTGGTPAASGAYEWSLAATYAYNSSGGWGVESNEGQEAVYLHSNDEGSSWFGDLDNIQFALNATPVPEPGTLSLSAVGGLIIALFRQKRFAAT